MLKFLVTPQQKCWRSVLANKRATRIGQRHCAVIFAMMLASSIGVGTPSEARADESGAKALVKAMSDHMAAQQAISFSFDTDLEIVTKDMQKLALVSSATVTLNRPDKLHVTRHGGFADAEAIFDGKTLSLIGRNANVYDQVDVPGSIDHLIDEVQGKYHRPVPGADLLQSNLYDALMPLVIDAKDLGSGVKGGVEYDHLAFRTDEVDWQIWIAPGARPYPCQYVSTSKLADDGPPWIGFPVSYAPSGTLLTAFGYCAMLVAQSS
jgi:hypothetical protein